MLVADNAAIVHPLTYLFYVILKHDFEVLPTFQKISERGIDLSSKDVLFVHIPNECDSEIKAIKSLNTLDKKPIIIVTRNHDNNRGIEAFLAGADDVVEWPCPLHELAARVSVRLGQGVDQGSPQDQNIEWETEVYLSNRAQLTTIEARVLRILYSHQGEIVTRDDLSEAIDGRPWQYGDRKFDVHVGRIRKKFSQAFGSEISVSTVRSSGYRLLTENKNIGVDG